MLEPVAGAQEFLPIADAERKETVELLRKIGRQIKLSIDRDATHRIILLRLHELYSGNAIRRAEIFAFENSTFPCIAFLQKFCRKDSSVVHYVDRPMIAQFRAQTP